MTIRTGGRGIRRSYRTHHIRRWRIRRRDPILILLMIPGRHLHETALMQSLASTTYTTQN